MATVQIVLTVGVVVGGGALWWYRKKVKGFLDLCTLGLALVASAVLCGLLARNDEEYS